MSLQTADVGLHDHAHSQEGAEDIGIVIQQLLLHLDGNSAAFILVKCSAQFGCQFLKSVAVVTAVILDRTVQAVGCKEVCRITKPRIDVSTDPNIPRCGILTDGVVILRAVDLNIHADPLERGLRRLGQQRKLLTGGISQPANSELDAILLANTIAIGVDPTGFLKDLLGLLGIIAFGLYALTKGEAVRESAGSGVAIAVEQHIHKALLVNAQSDRLADGRVLHDSRAGIFVVQVHHAPEAAAGLDAGELVVVVLKKRVAGISHAVGSIDFTRLESQSKCVAVRDGADGDLVNMYFSIPVVDVFHQTHVVVGYYLGCHIRTGADDTAVLRNTDFHVNNAAVGF